MSDLDDRYRQEGWGLVAKEALGIKPSDTESQARDVASWAHARICDREADIGALKQALAAERARADRLAEALEDIKRRAVECERIHGLENARNEIGPHARKKNAIAKTVINCGDTASAALAEHRKARGEG